ncbi:MAG: dephospho-CoA kinase [Alphaproteobacteria bacterium]|nr:dephospho-CoA kinase [Alphaproteobacteria bacterium]
MSETRPLRIGLTGSIGMGKSTTSQLFRDEGIAVFDSDAIVHELYQGAAVEPIAQSFPQVLENGVINRAKLADIVLKNPQALKQVEEIVHPLVWSERDKFFKANQETGANLVVYDIPLLFEKGVDSSVDVIVVVSATSETQKARVLARPGMTVEKFEALKSKQMSDLEKRARADFIIDTSLGLESARQQVHEILEKLNQPRSK